MLQTGLAEDAINKLKEKVRYGIRCPYRSHEKKVKVPMIIKDENQSEPRKVPTFQWNLLDQEPLALHQTRLATPASHLCVVQHARTKAAADLHNAAFL